MRIRKLELQNFKGFAGSHTIDFQAACKNLLVLGENGSGKTSIVKVLEGLLDASRRDVEFQRNLFCDPGASGLVKLTLDDGRVFDWNEGSRVADSPDTLIANASKAKGFLDYKGMLRTYFLQGRQVNIFDLLLEDILADRTNSQTNRTFLEDWNDIKSLVPFDRRKTTVRSDVVGKLDKLNTGLAEILKPITVRANQLLRHLDESLSINLNFAGVVLDIPPGLPHNRLPVSLLGQEIWLETAFHGMALNSHHFILNEARLSAIALCIYFAAVLETPAPELQILALDDVLIGLDMEHRLPILRVLEQYFADYHILLFTYDPVWFSIVQETVDENLWDFIRIHKPSDVRSQVPIIGDRGYLQTARDHLSRGDLRSAANYARSAFEKAMQDFCQKKSVPIRFKFLLKDLNSEDFLNAILNWQRGEEGVVIDGALQADIRAARRITLNPLSHAPPVPLTSREVQNAIDVVARLERALAN